MQQTPDLSGFNGSFPKPLPKLKKVQKSIGIGEKMKQWEKGRRRLKELFRDQGIVECEVNLEGCRHRNYLGFAHVRRRFKLISEQITDPHFVVLACQCCHTQLDFVMPRPKAEELLDAIVKSRGW